MTHTIEWWIWVRQTSSGGSKIKTTKAAMAMFVDFISIFTYWMQPGCFRTQFVVFLTLLPYRVFDRVVSTIPESFLSLHLLGTYITSHTFLSFHLSLSLPSASFHSLFATENGMRCWCCYFCEFCISVIVISRRWQLSQKYDPIRSLPPLAVRINCYIHYAPSTSIVCKRIATILLISV